MQCSIDVKCNSYPKPPSVFQAQMVHYENLHYFHNGSLNSAHTFSHVVIKVNECVLHYHEAIKDDDDGCFREDTCTEITSLKEENLFKLIPVCDKLSHEFLVPFVWSFKRKRDTIDELIKYKSRLCAHSGKQTKGIDFWNTHAPVFQSTAVRIMLILH